MREALLLPIYWFLHMFCDVCGMDEGVCIDFPRDQNEDHK